jgi:hypothetical protein
MQDSLSTLARANSEFGLHANDPLGREASNEVYSYKVFNEPYKIIVGEQHEVEINDENLVKRYFNAGQLALLACGFIGDVDTRESVERFRGSVTSLEFRDYFVVAAWGSARDALMRVDDEMRGVLGHAKLREDLAKRTKARTEGRKIQSQFFDQTEFMSKMERGARQCGIDEEVRKKIYSPFELQSKVEQVNGVWYLSFGGWLSVNEASIVLAFIKESVLPQLRFDLSKLSGVQMSPFAGRTLIDQTNWLQRR